MNLKAYIFLSLLTIFCATPSYSQLHDDELGNFDTLMVQQTLNEVTGRIIQVVRAKEFTAVANICSATLIGNNTILSAAHCFKRNRLLSEKDLAEKAALQIISEELYFDIPGITSHEFGAFIASVADENGVKVPNINKLKLNKALLGLPKIKDIQVLKEYKKNIPLEISETYEPRTVKEVLALEKHLKNDTWNYLSTTHDLSVAKLDRHIPISDMNIEKFDDNNDTIFIAGYYGGNLSEPLRVFKCKSNRSILQKLLPKFNFKSFTNLVSFTDRVILSACEEEIIEGQSGGPQVQIKNGKISLVGVNSLIVFSDTHILSPRVYNLKSKFKLK